MQIFIIGDDDGVKAVPVWKNLGYALYFTQQYDSKKKKYKAYCLSEKMLDGLENYVKLQRAFFESKKLLGNKVEEDSGEKDQPSV